MSETQPGTVYLVGAGPGDPGLLTLRARDLLRTVDIVLPDSLVSEEVLALIDGPAVIPVGKRYGSKSISQGEINELLVHLARDGKRLCRLKGGDPMVFVARHNPLGYDVRMELHGSRDSIVIGWDDRTPLRSVEPGFDPQTGALYESFFERFGQAFRAEMAEFLRVARREVESPCRVEDSQQSLRVAIAAERSRRERLPVTIASVG